jgi:hypothetical protein
MSETTRPARLTALMAFCRAVTGLVTMWTLTASRAPIMPTGSLMPS